MSPSNERAPYTDAEKQWLKTYFNGEYHFLQQHGLSIYKDEDREEGRVIVRSLMTSDNGNGGGEEEKEDDFLAELEADLMSHLADYHFTDEQLDFIKKSYRHSGNFLLSYGLKPFNDADCAEGKRILEAMMEK